MRWRRQEPEPGPSRADEALEASRQQLADARRQNTHWAEVAERLRQMRKRNHLGEAFTAAFWEGR